jgi:nucleotide-binding universal stress UspA family protein
MAEIKKVIIPVDFTSNMDKVVAYAVSVADQLGSKVLFFHVVNDFQGYDMRLVPPSFIGMSKDLEEQAKERMAGLVKDHEQREHGVAGNVAVGDAADEIIKYAESEKADMIIIGTHGTKGLERVLMGSTAERVAKKAPCPVLVFNPFK